MTQQGVATCLVSEGGRQVTTFMRLPESACRIDGVQYRMWRQRTGFTMEGPLGVEAVANRSGRHELTISSAFHEFQLRRTPSFRPRWDLYAGGEQIGSCDVGALDGTGDLPADYPLPVRVFALYATCMSAAARFLPWA